MEDLVRVGVHDSRCVEVDGEGGRRYRPTGGGMYEMTPHDAAAMVREGGFKPGIGPGAWAPGGHICPKGHRNYFKACGRCERDAGNR
jgi:hypothetical protein